MLSVIQDLAERLLDRVLGIDEASDPNGAVLEGLEQSPVPQLRRLGEVLSTLDTSGIERPRSPHPPGSPQQTLLANKQAMLDKVNHVIATSEPPSLPPRLTPPSRPEVPQASYPEPSTFPPILPPDLSEPLVSDRPSAAPFHSPSGALPNATSPSPLLSNPAVQGSKDRDEAPHAPPSLAQPNLPQPHFSQPNLQPNPSQPNIKTIVQLEELNAIVAAWQGELQQIYAQQMAISAEGPAFGGWLEAEYAVDGSPQYRLCSVHESGKILSEPCPMSHVAEIRKAIARYHLQRHLIDRQRILDHRLTALQSALDSLIHQGRSRV